MIISGTNEFTVFGLFRLAGIMAVYATLGTIIFERIWATVYLENYEKTISNIFFISCIAYHAICYITITFCIYKGIQFYTYKEMCHPPIMGSKTET